MQGTDWITWLTVFLTGSSVLVAILSVVISLICTLVPIGLLVWWLVSRSRKAKQVQSESLNWRMTTGKILKSRVEVSGGDTASVNAKIVYEYQVGGMTYQNDQVKAGDKIFAVSTSSQQYDLVDRYPVGATVNVYYNPYNPAESALER